MSTILHIQLLGDFSLIYGDTPVTTLNTGRSQALLAYLVLHSYTPQPRQRVAFQLWADSTDTQARANLRKELSYLRRALPDADQFLLIDGKTLQWHPQAPFTLDVSTFEQAVKAASQTTDIRRMRSTLEQAIELYRGDLLPDCADEWILPERERFQQLRVQALERLISLLEDEQDYRTAIRYAQDLLRIDGLNEATYCTLIRLYGLSGDRANALQIYHRCMTELREELGIDPSPTTRKLYEQLLKEDRNEDRNEDRQPLSRPASSQSPSILPPLPPRLQTKSVLLPLIGREREWHLIQQWMGETVVSTVLLLLGEPGIGKTRLLEELRDAVQARGGYVIWGQGFEAEMIRPYGAWIDALRSLAMDTTINFPPELGFLLPEVSQPAETLSDRSRLFDAVVQFLSQRCHRQSPVLIILDDIQWLDEASIALLHYAIRLLRYSPIQFACAARSKEVEENESVARVIQTLRREQRLQTVEVNALDREQTTELIRCVHRENQFASFTEQTADQIFIDSGGNPLFTLEVARTLSQSEQTGSTDTYLNNLELLIRDRLQRLDDSARALVPWAAALGRSFDLMTVAYVADCPPVQLLAAVEQLEQRSIIRPSLSMNPLHHSSLSQSSGALLSNEVCYNFSHDIVRQIAYRQLSEPRRRLIHLQIANKLEQRAAQDSTLSIEIAHHAALGGDYALAATASLSAAERCLKVLAYTEAAELAHRGIQHCPVLDDRTRIRLSLGFLRVFVMAGVTPDRVAQLEQEVHQLVSDAVALGLKDEEAVGLEALAILHFNHNNLTAVQHNSLRAAAASRTASPVTAAKMLANAGSCLAEIGREMTRAEAILLESQSLAARTGLELTEFYSGMGCVHRYYANYKEARTCLQQAVQQAKIEQDHWRQCCCLSYLVMTELESGNPAVAIPYCQEMAAVATKMRGEGSEEAFATALEALVNYVLQQPGADASLQQAIVVLQKIDAKRMLSYILIGAAEVDLQCDRVALAKSRAETALQTAQILRHFSEIALAWALLVQSTLASGNHQQAIECFNTLHPEIDCHRISIPARMAVERVVQTIQLMM